MSRPLVVSDDPVLIEDLARLAAVAGVDVDVCGSADSARSRWRSASVVLIGADAAPACREAELPRRRHVVIVCLGAAERANWAAAADLGVRQVLPLPDAEPMLVELLGRSTRLAQSDGATGQVVCVVGGCGGAGASVLAAALAITAARRGGAPLLLDADPFGGGLDLLCGAEECDGWRWPDLVTSRNEIPPDALQEGIPHAFGIWLVSVGRDDPVEIPPYTMGAVIESGRQFASPVIVDLPRVPTPAADIALAEANRVLLVVPAEVRAVVSARQVAGWVRERATGVEIVVRPGGLSPAEVARSLDLPLAGVAHTETRLTRALHRGDPPGRRSRGALASLCNRLLRATEVAA